VSARCSESCGFCGRCTAAWEKDGPQKYVCTVCRWRGLAADASAHHGATGHPTRGRDWPPSWGNAVCSDAACPTCAPVPLPVQKAS